MEECPMKEFLEMTERAFGLLSYLTSSYATSARVIHSEII